MKRFLVSLCISCFSVLTFAQEINGDWNALLNVSGQELPLVFHIIETDGVYSGTLDSPKQGALGLPMSLITYADSALHIELSQLGISYDGTLENEEVTGTFKQGGIEIPLNLSRGEAIAAEINRPQEPKAPFPYIEEEVTFTNSKGGHLLAGTLTMPKSLMRGKTKYPAVILITGSGPQDRNEELLGHKPFLVLADYLTRQGIAVLRYDDRGTAESQGIFEGATSLDFSYDAEAAMDYLLTRTDINPNKIGFVGHSEGGFIAPIIAARNKQVGFIALLAGVGQPGDELLVEQGYLIGKAQGLPEEELQENKIAQQQIFSIIKNYYGDTPLIKDKITAYLTEVLTANPDAIPEGSTIESTIQQQMGTITGAWFQYLIATDPAPSLEKVNCPVLAINGSLDLQVPPKANLGGIETAVKKGGNNDVTIVEIPNLNHLFQTSETGSPAEYATLEETFSPIALQIIGDWILEKTKK
jgi:pimeloyl-ACP methyl ester carboxylesterase